MKYAIIALCVMVLLMVEPAPNMGKPVNEQTNNLGMSEDGGQNDGIIHEQSIEKRCLPPNCSG